MSTAVTDAFIEEHCGLELTRELPRPGRALITIDDVHAAAEREYTRRFHLGPMQ